jgi:hypothetical protein
MYDKKFTLPKVLIIAGFGGALAFSGLSYLINRVRSK